MSDEMFGNTPECPICRRPHLTMGPGLRAKLAKMGLSEEALDAIAAEDANLVGTLHSGHGPRQLLMPGEERPPQTGAERMRRLRERKKGDGQTEH